MALVLASYMVHVRHGAAGLGAPKHWGSVCSAFPPCDRPPNQRLRQIAALARSVFGALEMEAVLKQVTATVTALHPDTLCVISVDFALVEHT